MLARVFYISWLLFLPCHLFSQRDHSPVTDGQTFIQYYPPASYLNKHRQNWCVIQDHRGMIYVGNTTGLLTFDGVKWRFYQCSNRSVIRSLKKDDFGRIYYGAKGEFGYLSADSVGTLQLIPLSDFLPDTVENIGDVWDIACTSDKVYFQSRYYTFRFDIAAISSAKQAVYPKANIWIEKKAAIGFTGLVAVNEAAYFQDLGKGLLKVTGDSLEILTESGPAKSIVFDKILPLANHKESEPHLLFVTKFDGLYEMNGEVISQVELAPFVQDFLLKNNLTISSAFLPNGHLAISTVRKGLLILDQDYRLVRCLNKSTGLATDAVTYAYSDRQEGLWLATEKGIARVETSSPLTFFSNSHGIEGNIYSITYHKESLCLGTASGIFSSSKRTPNRASSFQLVEAFPKKCSALASTGDELLAAIPREGLMQVDRGKETAIQEGNHIFVRPSRFDKRLVFMGIESHGDGGLIVYKSQDGWKPIQVDFDIPSDIRYIAEEAPGIIWLGHRTDGYYRVEIPALIESGVDILESIDSLSLKVEHITDETSITGGKARLFPVHGKLYLATNKGLKRFDPTTRTLVPDLSLGKELADTTTFIYLMIPGNNGEIWIKSSLTENSFGKLVPKAGGSFKWEDVPIINRIAGPSFNIIYPDPYQDDIVWLGGSEILVKYNLSRGVTQPQNYAPLIRRVLVNGDSLIYDGDLSLISESLTPPQLSYKKNNLRIEYAATSFDVPEKSQYQVWLSPFEEGWSDWTQETQKDYTNVPEGHYTFRLRAKNLYEVESQEAVFAFVVLPPWYRTWGAYFGYFLLLVGFIGGIVKWRERNLTAKNRALEAIIADRTRELAQKNEKLLALDQTKSRFFTNISHEFRTPLTVISGMVDQIKSHPEKWRDKGLEMIQRNSQQVLELVNQILDLRKLEAGSLELNLIHGDIVPYLRYIAESVHSYAEQKKVSLLFESDLETLMMDYDKGKVLSVVSNLLSNAIKFTPEGGEVRFKVQRLGFGVEGIPQRTLSSEHRTSNLLIQVSDTGIGIPPDKLPHIFDRFYQVDDSTTREEEGTGVGLALAQELVRLMAGQITVKSEVNKGSTFSLQLPIRHLDQVESEDSRLVSNSGLIPSKTFDQPLQDVQITKSSNDSLPSLLIVEDNKDVIQYLIACLENQYQLLVSRNGEEGIEMAIEAVPDLILSDVMMPRKDGLELCETLKGDERTSHIPIVLLTAKADVASRISGWERGADAYLAKPFDQPELLAVLKKLLELRRKLQARYASLEVHPPPIAGNVQQEDAFIQKLRQAIIGHLDDPTLNVTSLCDMMSMSRTQLHNKVKALTGRSATSFVRFVRLGEAKKLLAQSHLRIAEVAYQVGFSDPSYFSRSFTEEYGHAPSEAREQ